MNNAKLPRRISELPRDFHGNPVPWFVAWVNGTPDFRCVADGKIALATQQKLCWICGRRLGVFYTFVTGPLCAVNGTAAEPPSHRECGRFAAKLCPFLTNPKMQRRSDALSVDAPHPIGDMIDRNPGVVLLWTTKSFATVAVNDGVLFRVGPPARVEWMARGRDATRSEVVASLESGLVHLRRMAEEESEDAVAALEHLIAVASRVLPAA